MKTSNDDWLYRQIVQNSEDAVIFADRDGRIRVWNRGAERIFGYSSDEILGESLDAIIPDRLRQRHWEGYDRVMQTGVSEYGQELLAVPATRKGGERISVEFTIVLVRDESHNIRGAAAIIRDVTARWQRERELQQKLERLEERP